MTGEHLVTLLGAIFTEEGALPANRPESRPQRNRNPGDLRGAGWEGQTGQDEKQFCIFTDAPPEGYAALTTALYAEMDQLGVPRDWYWGYRAARLDILHHAATYPDQDLLHFVAGGQPDEWEGYAPASDSNDSAAYALALARALGVETTTTFAQL